MGPGLVLAGSLSSGRAAGRRTRGFGGRLFGRGRSVVGGPRRLGLVRVVNIIYMDMCECLRLGKKGRRHTTSVPPAHGAVARVVQVAARVAHARVVEPLVAEVLAVHVLDAPEATRGQCRLLGSFRDRGSGAASRAVGCYAEAGARCKGAE